MPLGMPHWPGAGFDEFLVEDEQPAPLPWQALSAEGTGASEPVRPGWLALAMAMSSVSFAAPEVCEAPQGATGQSVPRRSSPARPRRHECPPLGHGVAPHTRPRWRAAFLPPRPPRPPGRGGAPGRAAGRRAGPPAAWRWGQRPTRRGARVRCSSVCRRIKSGRMRCCAKTGARTVPAARGAARAFTALEQARSGVCSSGAHRSQLTAVGGDRAKGSAQAGVSAAGPARALRQLGPPQAWGRA
jgi:hypothetical protein